MQHSQQTQLILSFLAGIAGAALLLVLVFSLSAVLFTSVYALQVEQSKVTQLEAQIQ